MAITEPTLIDNAYFVFTLALRSPITRQKYSQRLGYFLSYLGLSEGTIEARCNIFADMAKRDTNWLTRRLMEYLQIHRTRFERKEISGGTLRNYLKPIKLFCEQLDITLPWKKIIRGLPKGRRYANDRAPTIEEIRKIVEYPDRRIKAIVYTMVSSGIRLGSWEFLKWCHVSPIREQGKIVAAKIIIYAGEEEESFTFVTPEAWNALFDWMDYRECCGEVITADSWLMRNLWDVTTPRGKGIVTVPKQLKSSGVKRLMERALLAQRIRENLSKGKKRHEFQVDHGYRKWFKTRCELAGVRSIFVERFLLHCNGISDNYMRPTESELLQEYLKAVDFLTINEENHLRKKVEELSQQNRDDEVQANLQEKDEQIKALMKKQEQFEMLLHGLIDSGQFRPIARLPKT